MSNQDRLDKLENLIVSAGGNVKLFNLMEFGGGSIELQQIENLLGDMIAEVLALKKELGCTSTLSIVENNQH
jgi:hypothetical protein